MPRETSRRSENNNPFAQAAVPRSSGVFLPILTSRGLPLPGDVSIPAGEPFLGAYAGGTCFLVYRTPEGGFELQVADGASGCKIGNPRKLNAGGAQGFFGAPAGAEGSAPTEWTTENGARLSMKANGAFLNFPVLG